MPAEDPSGYTLMVAGRRTGKTSFLRLLLDTCSVSSTVTRDQLASVAKFVQGCSGHTAHVRSVSIDIDLAPDEADEEHPLNLTLIDTPSLDFEDDAAYQRALQDILRHVEARLGESLEDERKAHTGDHLVHLCIYFLDPDHIVPPFVPAPPVPLVPRARTNSLSTHEHEPVILEPPVSSNPMLCRPILPASDISAIRRLSARVNVLPVVARADTLTTERLTAVKMAIRRDLAEAGIGFGIFDLDIPLYAQLESKVLKTKSENGFMKHLNGSNNSPPSTPITPTLLRLPFSLISPDIYSHSDGVTRAPLSRHELVHQYTPSKHVTPKSQSTPKVVPGKFVRNYRWGSLDVMDASHCEFLHLRGAIFHHMETLQKYTREYLFEKFKAEVQPAPPVVVRPQPTAVNRLPPMRDSRPVLAIDTAPPHANGNGHMQMPRSAVVNGEPLSAQVLSAAMQDLSPKVAMSARSQRQRAKKITVACNFCRSRKLKCDGGRPACGQCFKRSNPCDYTASNKRRNSGKQRKQYGSDSEGDSIEDGTADLDHPSHSPDLSSSAPHSRRSSNVSMLLTDTLPPLSAAVEPREEGSATLPPIGTSQDFGAPHANGSRRQSMNTELPPIATLSAPPGPQDDGVSLASFKDAESVSRRRTSSAASGSTSSRGGRSGSKIVACNFCRARKTRCDGAHPTCSSCSRRSLRCNYVNDPTKARSKSNSSGATPPDVSASTSSRSSPVASVTLSTPSIGESAIVRPLSALDTDMMQQPAKKMRLGMELSAPSIAVLNVQ
ncbi:hypothetical protein L226DRAFT_458954 [Lentinus tigrinus ALCF2SS1-7]|uniref:Zn(2)-C6 fungal-type domain-containing protein n=1 Tax=Lentinus tigrinus ALCF2SS1-6 TaxID=1328759 RepID=A0A5C2SGP7_9APHY|nr:hypothetical protein L227DRAFT_498727 [Lentinus tigrinus ALCF2SS1-6]RPD77875.1 hypothetical protein L226DRAFT_458954 [Lentinus tigrinus ALCF2SS1-7]